VRRRVLVTRAEPGAAATAERLQAAGFEPIVLPLTRIVAIIPSDLPDTEGFDALAVTSANALRHLSPSHIATIGGMPLFAVGEATAAEAQKMGLRPAFIGSGDGVDLAREILARLGPDSRILYLCGRVRSPGFETTLADPGIAVTALETYEAVPIEHATTELIAHIGVKPPWAALVHSRATGTLLAALADRPEVSPILKPMRIFGISGNAVVDLAALERFDIEIAPSPSEDALLALLSSKGG
jgi:uroporphyrinogen-III synthase